MRPSSWPAQDPGVLTLSPSEAGRSLPPFYYLQKEGRSLEAGKHSLLGSNPGSAV